MDTELVVIGAGVIGLAIAQYMADKGHEVLLLEKENQYGLVTSSRNSETIHAGVYYHTGSLKASLCLRGKALLYEHCRKYNVKHKRVGKLFLAVTSDEISRLEHTRDQALENGLDDLVFLGQNELKKMEPEIRGVAALLSPSTGIIDSHGLMKSLFMLGQNKHMIFAAGSPVTGAEPIRNGWKIKVGGKEPIAIVCRTVINAAGLHSIQLSQTVFPERKTPQLHPTKGSYLKYSGKSPVNHIIYPAMIPGVIEERVDATLDLGGNLRFGPNVEKSNSLEDFSLAPNLVETMISGIKRYLPNLDSSRLHPDFAGIRPKIYGPGESVEDFRIEWAPEPGWLDLWGMESPGLTAALAIAEHVFTLFVERVCD